MFIIIATVSALLSSNAPTCSRTFGVCLQRRGRVLKQAVGLPPQ